jgi:AraC-like DNA-binding protein/mannose-6-phosphate isomerase-like protein (cupin superfamily)
MPQPTVPSAPAARADAQAQPGRGAWRRERRTFVLEEVDSPEAIAAPFAIFAEQALAPVPLEFEPHAHALHELVWVRGGTMTVRLADRVLTVPEGQGLWIPAGTVHSGRMTAHTELCDAYFDTERSPVVFAEPTGIQMTPVLESLLTHLEDPDLESGPRLRAEAVVFDVLAPATRQISLQVPRGRRVAPIVAALLADPANDRSLSDWAVSLDVSERTVTRAFRQATGLSFVQWRQTLRVHRALELIAAGLEVQEVAERLGYAQPSTFIVSFKRVLGTTPGAYATGR